VTPDERQTLVRLANMMADHATARCDWLLAGVLHKCARAIAECGSMHLNAAEDRCAGCGGPLAGRQRQWCSDRCRMFASRSRSA
jgi:hypothetical protein